MEIPASPPAQAARLTVDMDRRTVTMDGTTYDVASVLALRWLAVLADRPGVWVSGAELSQRDAELAGARTDRLREHLPKQIGKLIESRTGAGSRIRLA